MDEKIDGQDDEENTQGLEGRLSLARRDALRQRKQVPPFVRKLSSLLGSDNASLIRWSDDGRSFIVIDEDEFARTLIPELFKHNNYASFVRQLNMYGLRKTFHITAGSLRQFGMSSKGTKPPNMYSHPYFQRDRADLLCLIQKPESRSSSKRTYDGVVKAVDNGDDEKLFSPPASGSRPPGELDIAVARSDPVPSPHNVIWVGRHELEKLQNHQQYISEAITQLKQQSDAAVRQAAASQAIHDKHENSIDAIRTFLANSYNCSTEGQARRHFVDMSGTVAERGNEQTDSVVEASTRAVPDGVFTTQGFELLPALKAAPFLQPQETPVIPQMAPSSARTPTTPVNGGHFADSVNAQTTRSQLLDATLASAQFEDCEPTRDLLQSVPDSNQIKKQQHNINVIGTTAPGTIALPFDFTPALTPQQIATVDPPLVAKRSDDMLDIVSDIQCCLNGVPISPTLPAIPDLNECKETQKQLEISMNLQKSQQSRVQELHFVPLSLSSSRSIYGVTDVREGDSFSDLTGAPDDFDSDRSINFEDDKDVNITSNSDYSQIDRSFCDSAIRSLANNVYKDDNIMLQHEEAMDGSGRFKSVTR